MTVRLPTLIKCWRVPTRNDASKPVPTTYDLDTNTREELVSGKTMRLDMEDHRLTRLNALLAKQPCPKHW